MNKHTKGPWTICFDGQIDGADGTTVCRFPWSSFNEFNNIGNYKADARLIAAAPTLLEALEALLTVGQPDGLRDKARAAISKATA